MTIRATISKSQSSPTLEGAGVKLRRAFGFNNFEPFDPFLMFDDFRNDNPQDYLAGFPWHPHRGIETITYVLSGEVKHADSLGNTGVLGAGSIQWMTAGSGILHQEMPVGDIDGKMHGFQLWANLPSYQKMTSPRYQDVSGFDIPSIIEDDGVIIKVIAGKFFGQKGPIDGITVDPLYLDISVPANKIKTLPVETYRNAFAYVFQGGGTFIDASDPVGVLLEKQVNNKEINIRDFSGNRTIVRFSSGDEIVIKAGSTGVRFLLIAGVPIKEPIAWHGPIVMNTKDEIKQAIDDLKNDTFIKASPV